MLQAWTGNLTPFSLLLIEINKFYVSNQNCSSKILSILNSKNIFS